MTAVTDPGHRVHYIDAVRDKRLKILMLAGDVDPVIPPLQVEATAATVGGEFVCFGDGPKDGPKDGPEGGPKDERDADGDGDDDTKEDPSAALKSMMTDGGDHYSHYDLLCGVNAPRLVFPVVSEFLERVEVEIFGRVFRL